MRHGRESRWFKWFWRDRTGNAAAEFALGLLFLIPLLFGIIEIGRLLHDFHLATQSVRDAGRFLARVPITPATCTATCTTCDPITGNCGAFAFDPDDITSAQNLAIYGTTVDTGPALLGYWDDRSTLDIEVCAADNSAALYAGIYTNTKVKWCGDNTGASGLVPHIKVTAHVPFTFMFGSMVVPNATMDIDVFHDTVAVGD